MPQERHLEAQILAQAVEANLSDQVDDVEAIAVDVNTDLGKIVQGKADEVSVAGEGLVIQQDIRVQELEMHAQAVAINPISALFGKIKLEQPLDTVMRVVLTEADLNQTLNSEAIRQYLFPWELNVDGKIATIELQQPMKLRLLAGGKMQFIGNLLRKEDNQEQRTHFSAVMLPRTEDQPVLLEEFRCQPGQGLPFGLTFAVFEKMRVLLEQPYLKWEEMTFRVQSLEVQEGSMVLHLEAYVYQIPDLGTDAL
ncbi:MAG TPA: DUF2993 domain-containing protein [Allocoleopsis sp.]